MNLQDRGALRQALLPAVLAEVPFDGWSRKTMLAAGASLALDAATVERAFPGGPVAVIDYWHDRIDAEMRAVLAMRDPGSMRLRDRVALAVRSRLIAMENDREAVRRAMALLSLPMHVGLGVRLAARTVDSIWQAVGDRSSDFSWYTRRASLATLYGVTLLYWLDDRSQGSAASWAFLERRLDILVRLPKLTGRLEAATRRLPDPFALLRRLRFGTHNG